MKITDNAGDRNLRVSGDWNLFVREAGNFRGNRSLAMRSLSRGAGSKQCRQESGRRINFKNSRAWRNRQHRKGIRSAKHVILHLFVRCTLLNS